MASSSSSNNNNNGATHGSFEDTCEAYSVDSRLFYNEVEQLSHRCFRRARRLVSWSRYLAMSAVAAVGIAGLASYYQRAQIYRVWRIRNPHRVRQLSLVTMSSGGFGLCVFLFLISPIGLMQLHAKQLEQTQHLDAMAVLALIQEQNFHTLAAWGRAASFEKESEGGAGLPRAQRQRKAMEHSADPLSDNAALWMRKQVVVDPTLLRSTKGAVTAGANQKAEDHRTFGKAQEASRMWNREGNEGGDSSGDAVHARVDAARRKMAVDLLLAPPPSETTADNAGHPGEEASGEADAFAQRRVWPRTTNEGELQTILAASVEILNLLVKAKREVVADAF
ncbi:hypothetical protein ABL78_3402 [Leptomonas seymouri]|uniref:Transmembrane protein n=1 Tax=Leptomonas seymouri TaxID=5684 RepID=A0A0N1IL14_LEPSE|nr:hypothetical protein ABL78_3402 [Leptomonas seymouri]|eukprot:KPI87524.1 hypothetical protein ABL78_3402 [Leptomonas seymouri]